MPAPLSGKNVRLSRRRLLLGAFAVSPIIAAGEAFAFEPGWLRTRRIRLGDNPEHRIVHFTDLHHKGDAEYLLEVVARVNAAKPHLVCFTGDIVEEKEHLPEALEILETLKAPLFGVPGNHDYWSGADFDQIARSFEKTGGAWLLDRQAPAAGGRLNLVGYTCENQNLPKPPTDAINVALFHYPDWVEKLDGRRFRLALAGHSHGGQIRLPFVGALVLPGGVGKYDLGRFETKWGPLYVSSGIGEFFIKARFLCRPEIVVFEI